MIALIDLPEIVIDDVKTYGTIRNEFFERSICYSVYNCIPLSEKFDFEEVNIAAELLKNIEKERLEREKKRRDEMHRLISKLARVEDLLKELKK